MSTIKSSAENLTLNADGANNDIKFQSNGSEVASIDQAGTVTATSFAGSGSNLTGISSVGGATGVDFNDSVKARFGTGNDLAIYHDQANSQNVLLSTSLPTLIASTSTKFANGANDTLRMTIDGDGLKFNSDTAAANALSDYEEGTFTASMTGSSSAPNNAITATGRYTKIGNFVFWSIHRFSSFNATGASGSIRITGMPFAADHSVVYTTFATHHMNFDAAKFQWGEQGASGTTIDFLESQNGGAWQNWNITSGAGLYMSLSGNYRAE